MATLKTILSKLPAAKRTVFLNNMRFANGQLININLVGTSGDQATALMKATGCTTIGFACSAFTAGECFKSANSACDASACKGNKGAVPVEIGSLLKAVPATPKRNYLRSIDYQNGKLISADIGLLDVEPAVAARIKKFLPSA